MKDIDKIRDEIVKEIFNEFAEGYVEGASDIALITCILKQFETEVRLDQLEIDYRLHLKTIKGI